MSVVLLVLFVMTMFMWLLTNLGVGPAPAAPAPDYKGWLAWFACLFLGLAVFVFPMTPLIR